jgi:pimeloyl-ACP methyl ester carboxylesterase
LPDLKLRGFRMHYVEQGEGPAVVFVHGLVMDHTMYEAQFEELPDLYRCIALDLRGHGHSGCPPGPWSMHDSVDDVIAFIEGVDAAPCHLVGMSWGGMIGVRIAVQRPELVRSLVLIDTSAGSEDPQQSELRRTVFMEPIAAHGITDELVAASILILFGEKYQADEPAMAVYADRVKSMKREAIVEGLRAVLERDSVLDRLGQIRVPTLVIHGEQDASIPMSVAEAIVAGIAGARLVAIPDAGHSTPLEAPDAVNTALAGFFAGQDGQT